MKKNRKKNPPSKLHQTHFIHTIYMCYTVLEKWICTGFSYDFLTPTMNLLSQLHVLDFVFMIFMAQVAGCLFFLLEE